MESPQARWSDLWSAGGRDNACRLRFELGGEQYDPDEDPVPRALQAFTRAAAVADTLLGDACLAVAATYIDVDDLPPRHWPPPHMEAGNPFGDGFAALLALGFRVPAQTSWQARLYEDEEVDGLWYMRSFDLTGRRAERDTLLWNAVVAELPISPRSPTKAFLLHPTYPVMLHVYDDRGMDVTAADAPLVRPIYEQFDGWLLDYDRPRMKRIFA